MMDGEKNAFEEQDGETAALSFRRGVVLII